MERLASRIEYLLLSHDCVIVPEVGGFVLQIVSAGYSFNKHMFHPMRKEVVFNSTLNHQDGLLAEAYMKKFGADYAGACSMIEADVEGLRKELRDKGQVDMGLVGTLAVGEEGQVVFTPSKDDVLCVDFYGLTSFHLTPLSDLKKEEAISEYENDTIYIRINKRVLRAVSSVAAVIALILLISTPVKDVNTSTYTASFIPMETSKPKSEMLVADSDAPRNIIETGEDATSTSLVVEAVSTTPDMIVQTPSIAQPKVRTKSYYAIIGSFPRKDLAMKYIAGTDKQLCPNVDIVANDDRIRVYAGKFSNREDAESYINTLRTTDKYKDAWLYIGH